MIEHRLKGPKAKKDELERCSINYWISRTVYDQRLRSLRSFRESREAEHSGETPNL